MYLDPGFGGMLIQIIVALATVAGATVFAMRKKIRSLFSRGNKGSEPAAVTELSKKDADDDDVIDTLAE